MEILKNKLGKLLASLSADNEDKIKTRLENLISVYPFNEYEYIISGLLGLGKIFTDSFRNMSCIPCTHGGIEVATKTVVVVSPVQPYASVTVTV